MDNDQQNFKQMEVIFCAKVKRNMTGLRSASRLQLKTDLSVLIFQERKTRQVSNLFQNLWNNPSQLLSNYWVVNQYSELRCFRSYLASLWTKSSKGYLHSSLLNHFPLGQFHIKTSDIERPNLWVVSTTSKDLNEGGGG